MKGICEGIVKRILLFSLFIFVNLLSFGATYYLAPNGSDSNSGTISSPWFSLNKAWTVIKAGDTVYLRGGTYAFSTQQNLSGKKGALGSLIQILAYPGETPVLTKSASYTVNEGIRFVGDYFYWKGIEITGFTQISSGLCDGFRVENSSYNTFELLKIHGNGNGMQIANLGYDLHSTGNLVLNCDFYENQDPLTTDKYGNADGLAIEWITHPEDVNTIRGCRFWWNTDDGLDLYHNDGTVIIENCQSFYNGYIPNTFTTAGDGNGFKLGDGITDQRNSTKRIVKDCISVKNRTNGYTPNALYGIIELYNCTAYANGNIGIHISDFNLAHVAKNCLSYANSTNLGLSSIGTYVTNSWQNSLTVSSTDFKSLDLNLLIADRAADGSIVANDFLALNSTSKLIDKGTNVGLPYNGNAPDIGSYEYASTAVIAPTAFTVTGGGSYCAGGNGVVIGLNGSQTGVNYQLKSGTTNIGSPLAGTGSALNFGYIKTAGNYTVVGTNAQTAAVANMTGSASVVVNSLPITSFASGISTAITGTSAQYVATSGMSNYKWTVSTGGTFASGATTTTNTASVSWTTTGTQYVTVNYTDANGCTSAQAATYTVTVNAPATNYYNVTGGGAYCDGGTGVTIGLSGSQSGYNYQLKVGGVNVGSAVAGTGGALSFGNQKSAGSYTVAAIDAQTSAKYTMNGNATIVINPLPVATFTSGVSSAVAGTTGSSYIVSSGMSNYKWSVSTGGTITSGGTSSSNSALVTWATAGTQFVNVSYTDANGCTSAQAATYSVTVSAPLTGSYSVTGGGSFCDGSSGVLVGLNGSQVGVNYQLQLNGANIGSLVAGTGNAISFGAMTQPGTYTVIGINTLSSTSSNMSGSAKVSVNPVYAITEYIQIENGQNYMGWTTSGQYVRKLATVLGCDSVVTTNLTVLAAKTIAAPTQTIQLKKGNNLISSYLVPPTADAGVVIKPLIDQGALYKIYNEDNKTIEYSSKLGRWTNSIGAWGATEGYLVTVNFDCQLPIAGNQVALPLNIPLKPGWNIISYPRTDIVNAMSVIQPLIDQNKLVKVQDEVGNSIENLKSYGGWVNNIGNFIPGKAYKVYVSTNATLTIQAAYTKSISLKAATLKPEHFVVGYDGNGLNHMNINIVGLNSGAGFAAGDELAAFDGKICVGALKLTQDQIAAGSASLISSSATKADTTDGFTDGHPIKMIVWKKSINSETAVTPEIITGTLSFEQNGSVLTELKSAVTTGNEEMINGKLEVKVYPNPSKGDFSVSLGNMPEWESRIEIVDMSGRVLATRQITNTVEEFSLNNLRNGMYLVRTITGTSQILSKLIISK